MRAASILHYYKRLAQHDLINFSEKFGTPGLVVHTTGGKDSPEGQAAANLAREPRRELSRRAVRRGGKQDRGRLAHRRGDGAQSADDRRSSRTASAGWRRCIWARTCRTLSRAGQAVGASVQGEERARRERADCARIEETLNAAIDPVVLRWFFGDAAPILARLTHRRADQRGPHAAGQPRASSSSTWARACRWRRSRGGSTCRWRARAKRFSSRRRSRCDDPRTVAAAWPAAFNADE